MRKIIKIVFGSAIAVLLILFAIGTISMSNTDIEYDDSPEALLAHKMEVSKEIATPINVALQSVGIDYVSSIEHDVLLDDAFGNDEIGYRVSTLNVDNIILYLNADSSVYQIKYAGNILFDNGESVKKIDDFYLTEQQKESIIVNVQEGVRKLLKSPSTAVFPNHNEWFVIKVDGVTTVQSYVDAQNSFGAMLRSEFVVTIEENTVVSLVFDGKEYMKQ